MEIYEQIAAAKKFIKGTKMKKEGKNTFSNYQYFTPSQIAKLVDDACDNNGLLSKFDLIRDELGEKGVLTIFSIASGDSVVYEMATAIPSIKATNIAQQLGGCVTYTERYLKTSAFGIVDNSLDFDTTENTKKAAKPMEKTKSTLTKNQVMKLIDECKTTNDLTALKAKEPVWMDEKEVRKYATDRFNVITKGF